MAKVPHGRSLVDTYSDQPFALVGVNTDDPSDDLLKRTRDKDISWRSFADGAKNGPISTAWGVTAFPTTFLIDHTGVVRGVDLEGEDLDEKLKSLLTEAAKDL